MTSVRLSLAILLLCAVCWRGAVAEDEDHWTIGPYRVALTDTGDDTQRQNTLTVSRDGRVLYRLADAALDVNPTMFFTGWIPHAKYEDMIAPYEVGADLLGLGAPTLVVRGFTFGAHCCFSMTVLVLGDEFRALPTVDLRDGEMVDFRKVPGRDALVFGLEDFTFAYWWAPFALSSSAPVHLAYDKALGRYVADADLMRAPLPPPEKLTAQREAAHAAQAKLITEGQWFVPPELTRPILELIYTGHLDAARDFVEKAWAGADDRRAAYWSDLIECQLRLSPYWPVVAAMNGLAAETPVMPCPRPWPDGSVLHGWQMVK